MLKKLFTKLISLIITSLLFISITTVISLSLLTKKFPPDIKAARQYADDFMKLKDNYQMILVRSQNIIQQQGITDNAEDGVLNHETTGSKVLAVSEKSHPLQLEIDQLKTRMIRLEEQNRQIIEALNRK